MSHWWWGDITLPQQTHFSSLGASFSGDSLREETSSVGDLRISLWLLPLWIFKPISDLKDFPQKLQSKPYSFLASFSRFESARFSSSVDSLGGSDFFLQNSSFLLRFLLIWHRESFFLFLVTSLFVDYLEVEMMFRVDSGPSREVEKAMVALPSLQQHPPAADELSNCIVDKDLAFQHLLAPGWHQVSKGLAVVVSKEHHCSHFLSEVDKKCKRECGHVLSPQQNLV